MSYQKQSFGMMDEGYFVPRGQLIDWINDLLDLSITKIQQLGSGSIYCQIVDVIHPGKVAMNKLNWKAKNDYQFINNLKVLQSAFQKAGVKRYVDVQKLAKTKYQDNLEFIQWLKRYYDLNCGDRGKQYNPKERRGNCAVDFSFADKNIVPKSYNSGGQVTSKTDLPGKKTTTVIPNKSSVAQIKPPTKTEMKITTKPQPKIQKKPQPKTQHKSQLKSQIKTSSSKIGLTSSKKIQSIDWQAKYQQQVKKNEDLNLKIGMVEQVLKSDENSDLKIAMIQQVIGIVRVHKEHKAVQQQQYAVQATQDSHHQQHNVVHEQQDEQTI